MIKIEDLTTEQKKALVIEYFNTNELDNLQAIVNLLLYFVGKFGILSNTHKLKIKSDDVRITINNEIYSTDMKLKLDILKSIKVN